MSDKMNAKEIGNICAEALDKFSDDAEGIIKYMYAMDGAGDLGEDTVLQLALSDGRDFMVYIAEIPDEVSMNAGNALYGLSITKGLDRVEASLNERG